MRNIAIACGLALALFGCAKEPEPAEIPTRAEIEQALSLESRDALEGYDRCMTKELADGAKGPAAAEDCASAIRYAETAVQDDIWVANPDLSGKDTQRLAKATVKRNIKSKFRPRKRD